MADRGSGAVISRIASADNHNVLPLRLDILSILEMGIQQAFRIPREEIDRKIDSLCIASGSLQVSCLLRPAGKHDGIVLLQKGLRLDILPDIHTGQEGDALLLHDADLAVHDLLLQLHVRDPVHQKAPDAVIALIHRHLMTSVIQHIRTGKSGRAGADDRHLLPCTHLRRLRSGVSMLIGILNDRILIFPRCDSIPVHTAGAGLLAERRTNP